jgi:fatty acid desaturase
MAAGLLALRFGILNALALGFIVALVFGGAWIWLALGVAILGTAVFDELIGDQGEHAERAGGLFYAIELYAALPLLLVITIIYVHYLIKTDPIGMVHALSLGGVTFGGATGIRSWPTVAAATFATSYFYSFVGMTVAHELLHWTNSALAQRVARTLLALNLNTPYAIAHLHGHHRNVATFDDPSSARRGEYVLVFVIRCIFGELREALRIEKARLRKKGLAYASWHNRVLQDEFYTVCAMAAVALIGGIPALIGFTIAAALGGGIQRFIDYTQHYGLARIPGTPIAARHSWDCERFLTNATQFNLALHADHHLAASKPYWELRPKSDAPRLPCGYVAASLIALFPPLWRRMIDPLLEDWDRRLATEEERRLVAAQKAKASGITDAQNY